MALGIYDKIRAHHQTWSEEHGYAFNNLIIDMLRNRLWHEADMWYEFYVRRRPVLMNIPEELRCERDPEAAIYVRRFKGQLKPEPCEICGFDRSPELAHIIPKSANGPDDDWNLAHLCANHHYLFDRGLLAPSEWDAIGWEKKGAEARYFAQRFRLPQHEEYWASTPNPSCEAKWLGDPEDGTADAG